MYPKLGKYCLVMNASPKGYSDKLNSERCISVTSISLVQNYYFPIMDVIDSNLIWNLDLKFRGLSPEIR